MIKSLPVRVAGIIAVLVLPLSASVIETGEDVQFTPLHHIEDDVYTFSEKNISMDAFIDGDFTAFAYSVTTNGEVTGTVNMCARNFNHNGNIGGSVRVCAETANINGSVGRSVLICSNMFTVSSKGIVERDIHACCAHAEIFGRVDGNVDIIAGEVRITGVIDGNVDIIADNIIIAEPAIIRGDFTYESEKEARIDTAGVIIEGKTEWTQPEESGGDGSGTLRSLTVAIAEMLAAFVFGLILLIPFRSHVSESLKLLRKRMVVSLATGFLTVMLFLLMVVVALLTTISFLIGYGLISGDAQVPGALVLTVSTIVLPIASFGAVSGGILFYTGKIILAFMAGIMAVQLVKKNAKPLTKTQLLIGLIFLAIVFGIPYLGALLYFLGSMAGAGAIILAIRKLNVASSEDESVKDTETSPSN